MFDEKLFQLLTKTFDFIGIILKIILCKDEGVSLTATPGSSLDGCHHEPPKPVADSNPPSPSVALSPPLNDPKEVNNHEHKVDVQLSNSSLCYTSSAPLQHNSSQLEQDSTPLLNRQNRGNTPLHSTGSGSNLHPRP